MTNKELYENCMGIINEFYECYNNDLILQGDGEEETEKEIQEELEMVDKTYEELEKRLKEEQ